MPNLMLYLYASHLCTSTSLGLGFCPLSHLLLEIKFTLGDVTQAPLSQQSLPNNWSNFATLPSGLP